MVLFPWPAGLAAAVTLAIPSWVGLAAWQARRPTPRRAPADRGELPLTLDLIAAVLRSGVPIGAALAISVSDWDSPVGTDLRRVAGLLQLGADADSAWRELLDDPVLAPVARTAARSVRSGAKLADGLERLAVQLRADLIGERRSHAQRVGIWAMAPLGLCFLPAFICIGIVPVIAGIAHDVLPGVLR